MSILLAVEPCSSIMNTGAQETRELEHEKDQENERVSVKELESCAGDESREGEEGPSVSNDVDDKGEDDTVKVDIRLLIVEKSGMPTMAQLTDLTLTKPISLAKMRQALLESSYAGPTHDIFFPDWTTTMYVTRSDEDDLVVHNVDSDESLEEVIEEELSHPGLYAIKLEVCKNDKYSRFKRESSHDNSDQCGSEGGSSGFGNRSDGSSSNGGGSPGKGRRRRSGGNNRGRSRRRYGRGCHRDARVSHSKGPMGNFVPQTYEMAHGIYVPTGADVGNAPCDAISEYEVDVTSSPVYQATFQDMINMGYYANHPVYFPTEATNSDQIGGPVYFVNSQVGIGSAQYPYPQYGYSYGPSAVYPTSPVPFQTHPQYSGPTYQMPTSPNPPAQAFSDSAHYHGSPGFGYPVADQAQ